MAAFSFAPPNMGFGDTKKNYVFVDEHNRHKRLKVMRACEGCRRRKIKCDAATTNSWPCAACVRLKLTCVPPTVNYNRSNMGGQPASGLERVLDFADSSGDSGDEGPMVPMPRPLLHHHHTHANVFTETDLMASSNAAAFSSPGMLAFSAPTSYPKKQPDSVLYGLSSVDLPATSYQSQSSYFAQMPSVTAPPQPPRPRRQDSTDSWSREDVPVVNLNEVMGELNIDANGTAPYITQQKRTLAEAPALEEVEYSLPSAVAASAMSGATVRIPPELMPDEDLAMEYLKVYFDSIHPYVPVISKSYFYKQWHTNRTSISPLLLEAIFACAGRASDDPAQGAQWLALASKHENCFMDVPRLSTIQALLILLKAREANPKRGYYYRSWMTLRTICTMAKDLELDEHLAAHRAGRDCSDATECLVKTRIWQTMFLTEIMVGGPQGRRDMGTDPNTVDFSVPVTPPGGDDDEYQTSRDFVHFARIARNVRAASDVVAQLVKEGNSDGWASHPRIAALNPTFPRWLDDLPSELQIHYPPDDSPPWLPSHFVGNLHCYHHLSILLLHRPQLLACSFTAGDAAWKQHMTLCYRSAKLICRIQESLLSSFGINGLICTQRGVNFAIYCVLTCTLLHLSAITSPDPEYNTDAKEFFTRHMRILEHCTKAWPMQDMQAQINSLREAFSADINKPFELKPSFPFGSPQPGLADSPKAMAIGAPSTSTGASVHIGQAQGQSGQGPVTPPQDGQQHNQQQRSVQQMHVGFQAAPMTPPISTGESDSKEADALVFGGGGRNGSMEGFGLGMSRSFDLHTSEDDVTWNPTRLFDQWNAAFDPAAAMHATAPNHHGASSTLSSNHSPPPPLLSPTASTVSHDLSSMPDSIAQPQPQQHFSAAPNGNPAITLSPAPSGPARLRASPPSAAFAAPPLVSPSMWRETVARMYVQNDLKRRWDSASGPSSAGWGPSGDGQMLLI